MEMEISPDEIASSRYTILAMTIGIRE
jgi:hypothetical protein